MNAKNANPFDLTGKVALVTGGAGIIGSRVCHGLAEHGASLAIAGIDGDAAKALAKSIASDHNTTAIGIACDVADPDSVARMVQSTCDQLGGIDILHNNAATKTDDLKAFFAPVEDYSLETWRKVMSVNLDGMFLVAQAVGKRMIKQGRGGSIIQMASIYGVVGPDPRLYEGSEYLGVEINTPPVYAASKGGVLALSKYLATHWASQGIRVNTLVPGGVESGQNKTFKEKYAARVPLGRMAEADEIVGAVIFMASDASSYMTGQMVVVDGGWTAW